MTYFVGHCIFINDSFIPFSVIPVDILSLDETLCPRDLVTNSISLQLFWQPYRTPRCGAPAVVKTHYIRKIQYLWRRYIKWRKKTFTPRFFLKRECNIK